jgi:aminoglycoside phosphotransferase (APT) family kinase protein
MRGEADPPPRGRALTHGDFHLGQLVRLDGGWRLIDLDGIGVGDPVWDLARLAAWFAGGVIPPPAWNRFVGGYRAAAGPALPPHGDPWTVLDAPARALVAQIAGLAIVNGDLDVAETFVACCRRITAMYPVCAPGE